MVAEGVSKPSGSRARSGKKQTMRIHTKTTFTIALALTLLVVALGTTRVSAVPPLPGAGATLYGKGQTKQDFGTFSQDGRSELRASAALTHTLAYSVYLPIVSQGVATEFTFVVTADMREYSGPGQYDTPQYFRGACETIAALGGGAFMVSPGDIDPPADVEWTIEQYIGQDYIWYPVVGNHEAETTADMEWLRAYGSGDSLSLSVVNAGPSACGETTYSFDYGNSHFVVLNEYCDGTSDTGTDGDVVDALYNWLVSDLSTTDREHIFVFGHEPAYPQPDADSGRLRHLGDSLDAHPANRDRFWALLKDKGVIAYICGHTHNYSAVNVGGVWQLDTGHARGIADTGAPSTFILVHVEGGVVTFEAYRDDANGGSYTLAHSGILADGASSTYQIPIVIP